MISYDDLARRLVKSPHFRWMPGMLTSDGSARCVAGPREDGSILLACADQDRTEPEIAWVSDVVGVPCLTDAATIGCLLALVREAWGGRSWSSLIAVSIGHGWRVGDGLGWIGPTCESEAEALVLALESARSPS